MASPTADALTLTVTLSMRQATSCCCREACWEFDGGSLDGHTASTRLILRPTIPTPVAHQNPSNTPIHWIRHPMLQ